VFRHWEGVAKRSAGHIRPQALIDEALGFLISSDWVIGEAQELNIHASARQVRRQFDRDRHEQFPTDKEFKAFLKSSGQTVADLLFRVRLSILSDRIQRHAVAGQHGAAAQEQALSRFVSEFKSKWQARTYCSPQYAVSDCGHVQAVL
jgi:foldase protein PrsA